MAVVLAPVLSGCLGSSTEVLVPGTGYTTMSLVTENSTLIDADMNPGRSIIVTTHDDGMLRLWDLNGSSLSNWTIPYCTYLPGCFVRFLSGDHLLTVSGDRLRIWSGHGDLLFSPALPGEGLGVGDLAVVRGGQEVLLGLYRLANHTYDQSPAVLNVANNVTTPLVLGEGQNGYLSAASADGTIVATSGSSVQFWRRPSELLGEVSGMHEVAIDANGSFAALRVIYAPQTANPHGVLAVNLSITPLSVRSLSASSLGNGVGPPPKQLFLSAGGGFVAVNEQVRLKHCGGIDCVVTSAIITRIVEVDNPGQDRGFGPGASFRVFLADDGSAIAVTFGVSASGRETGLVVVNADSTPPHVVQS